MLEAFDFDATTNEDVKAIADWLAANALPQSTEHEFFRNKLKADLVVLSDTEFGHFVRHATVVEAHVKIDNDTGAADKAHASIANFSDYKTLAMLKWLRQFADAVSDSSGAQTR